jgi:hypothetical protein
MYLAVSAHFPGNTYASENHVTHVDLTGTRPIEVSEVEDLELGAEQFWSDFNSWRFKDPDGNTLEKIPEEDDIVVIESDMNIILDLPAD